MSDGSPTLSCNHEAPIVFDTTQVTSKSNYSEPKPGAPCHPLAAGTHAPAIAFTCKDHGADAGDVSPTLRSMEFKDSHINGGGQVVIAFKPSHYTRDKDGAPSEQTPPLSADADKGDQDPLVFQPRYFTRDNKTGGAPAETADVTNCAKAGDSAPHLATTSAVRRLTPLECLRLQGLPDSWFDDLNFSDSVKYRAIGNSVAVPVFEWVARRIKAHLEK